MKTIKRWWTASLVLGCLSLFSFILERLALTDIFHGEPDLNLEWRVVSVSLLPILAFHVVTAIAAVKSIRQLALRRDL
jgi:hypothetical protein